MGRRFGWFAGFAAVLLLGCGERAGTGDMAGAAAEGPGVEAAGGVAYTDQGIRKISAAEVLRSMDGEPGPVVLDVRSQEEYRASHIPGAINIPYDRIRERLQDLRQFESRDIVLVCRTGRRAGIAGEVLLEAGFESVWDLDGHMVGWAAGDLPLEGSGECC